MAYIQDEEFSKLYPTLIEHQKPIYKVQANDVLSIKVHSLDPGSSSFFYNETTNFFGTPQDNQAQLYLNGYSVNTEGNIHLPTIGEIKVINHTVSEVEKKIQESINEYLNNATVSVKLVSFKISILGEVNNPGHIYVYNGQANLFEGLSMAGDLSQEGNRRNVKLIRQKAKGSEIILLDLTDPNLIESPYFHLMPNDILYIEPQKASTKRGNLDLLDILFGGITTFVLIFNAVDASRN
ncbi:polysaccharide export protein [Cytophagales bacterium RKSG123]|nr:polysaccharide export protein [Xanthovirga aplysinae]